MSIRMSGRLLHVDQRACALIMATSSKDGVSPIYCRTAENSTTRPRPPIGIHDELRVSTPTSGLFATRKTLDSAFLHVTRIIMPTWHFIHPTVNDEQ